jgi:hypothetical protein
MRNGGGFIHEEGLGGSPILSGLGDMLFDPLHVLLVCDIDSVIKVARVGHAGGACFLCISGNGPVQSQICVLGGVALINHARVHVMAKTLVDLAYEVVKTLFSG